MSAPAGPTAARAVAIVPVRVGSRRLPEKALLADTDGCPLFLHTCAAARRARSFAQVYVATDDERVAAAAAEHDVAVLRTSAQPRTGSERCAEAARALDDIDIVVDLQGDWPEVAPADLDALVDCLGEYAAPTATLAAPLSGADAARGDDPNVVKVVRGLDGDALYFSRAPIPFARAGFAEPDARAPAPRLRHIGVYGFTIGTLLAIPELPSSGLAETEGLEQLRFLENGIRMRVLDTTGAPWGIETKADYDAFVARWRARQGAGDGGRGR